MGIADQKGKIIDANPQAARLLGCSLPELINTNLFDLLVDPTERERLRKSLEQNGTATDFEIKLKEHGNHAGVFLAGATLQKQAEEKHIFFCFQDISSRKNAEETIKYLLSELQNLDSLKTEFLLTVSHELRTPLSIIREGVSQILEGLRGPILPEQQKALAFALNNIDRLTRLINNLLNMSKIEAGRVEIHLEEIELLPLLDELREDFQKQAAEKGLSLKFTLPANPIQLKTDKDKLTQILTNLLCNALKFTQRGSIELIMTDKPTELEFQVVDSGPGIPPEHHRRVFSKFEQFSRQAGPGEKGTGLGLAISKGLVELLGGQISFHSTIGQGTTFTVTLPKISGKRSS